MKAAVFSEYGPPEVLRLVDVDTPTTGAHNVLIRVHASNLTAGDCEFRAFRFPPEFWPLFRLMFGVRGPRNQILGQELAGEVVQVGENVTRFSEGDQIFATTTFRFGAHTEYISLPDSVAMAPKPANLSWEEAAVVPVGGLNALHFLRKANVQNGEKVLINGAGGSIGTIAVQLAKYFGADVTAVDSVSKLEMLRSIGADHVIDYTREDFTKLGETWDVIIDVVGKSPYSQSLDVLNENGRYVLANLRLLPILRGLWTSRRISRKVIPALAGLKSDDLIFLKERIEDGTLTPVLDRSYPLEEIVEAHRYVESGQKQGSVAITLIQNDATSPVCETPPTTA